MVEGYVDLLGLVIWSQGWIMGGRGDLLGGEITGEKLNGGEGIRGLGVSWMNRGEGGADGVIIIFSMSSLSFWKTNGYLDFTHEGQVNTLADLDNWIIMYAGNFEQ